MKTSTLLLIISISSLFVIFGCDSAKKEKGLKVVVEINSDDLIRSLVANQFLTDPVFTETMALAHEKKKDSQSHFVDLFAEAFEELNPGAQLAQFFMSPETRGEIDFNSTNSEVIDYLEEEFTKTIDYLSNRLDNRLENFGFSKKKRNIENIDDRLHVTITHKSFNSENIDLKRISKLLSTPGKLEFWTTYQAAEVWNYLDQANQTLADILMAEEETEEMEEELAVEETPVEQEDLLLDTTGLDLLTDLDSIVDDQETQFYRENPLIAVLTPYLDNARNFIPGSTVGVVLLKDTATVNAYLAIPQIRQLFPSDLKFAWHFQPQGEEQQFIRLHALRATRNNQPVMEGKYISDAKVDTDPYTGEFQVNMNMNSEGAKKWANVTRENVNQAIAIVLDGLVYSAPNVSEEIKGGSSSISGNFTQWDAEDLANILKSNTLGYVPCKTRIVSMEFLEPTN